MIAFVEKELNGRVNNDSIKLGFFNSWGIADDVQQLETSWIQFRT